MADILHQVGIGATPDRLYTALTDQADLRAWWSEHTEAEAEVGALNKVSFYGGMVAFELRVKKLEQGKQVVWAVEGGPPDWLGTDVTWTISVHEGQTMLHLSHSGFASTGGNFAGVNYNWGWYITSLKFYLEKGEGMPHTDADIPQ
jgi:uncharacterized protein YndB with AHSA1/START domain